MQWKKGVKKGVRKIPPAQGKKRKNADAFSLSRYEQLQKQRKLFKGTAFAGTLNDHQVIPHQPNFIV